MHHQHCVLGATLNKLNFGIIFVILFQEGIKMKKRKKEKKS